MSEVQAVQLEVVGEKLRLQEKDPEDYTLEDAVADFAQAADEGYSRDHLVAVARKILDHRRIGAQRWGQELLLSTYERKRYGGGPGE